MTKGEASGIRGGLEYGNGSGGGGAQVGADDCCCGIFKGE